MVSLSLYQHRQNGEHTVITQNLQSMIHLHSNKRQYSTDGQNSILYVGLAGFQERPIYLHSDVIKSVAVDLRTKRLSN